MNKMQPIKLYNDEVEIEFNPGNHRYKVNGEYKPGVTGILNVINKPLLMGWAAYMAAEDFKDAVARLHAEGGQITDKWLKEAADSAKTAYGKRSDVAKDLGHEVHSLIEQYLLGNELVLDANAQSTKLFQNFQTWHKQSGYVVKGTEQIVYSRKYDYCGTFDVLFDDKGQIILGDVKTTKRSYTNQMGVYTEYIAQLGAYALAYEEETGNTVSELVLINPDKEYGEMQFIKLSDLSITVDEAKQSFLKVLDLYNSVKPLEFKLKNQNTHKKGAWYLKNKIGGES